MHPIKSLKDAVAWAAIQATVKKAWRHLSPEDQKMTLDFLQGSKTKWGAAGAFITGLGAVVGEIAVAPPADFGGWMVVAQKVFLLLGGYGGIMKLIRWFEAKHDPATAPAATPAK